MHRLTVHGRRTVGTTRSPGDAHCTSGPDSMTSATASCPRMKSDSPVGGSPYSNAQISRSVPQTPTSIVRSNTSVPRQGFGAGRSVTVSVLCSGLTTTARILSPAHTRSLQGHAAGNHADVAEGLWEIADETAGGRVYLLRQQSERARPAAQRFIQAGRLVDPALFGQILHEPEAAQHEGAFIAGN